MRIALKPGRIFINPTVAKTLQKTLAGNPAAKAVFDKLPPSHRNEYVKWISEAKKEETRQRRLAQLIPKLLAKA